MIFWIVFLPFVTAALSWLAGCRKEEFRDWFVAAAAGVELALCLSLFASRQTLDIPYVVGSGLHFASDGFRTVYAVVTAFMWFFTCLFSREYFAHEREGLNGYFVFVLMTLGATEGVMLSADLMTTFFFFEILSFTSFTWVIHEQTPGAVRAGYTYLFSAVIGGLVLFMGLALMQNALGTLRFDEMRQAVKQTGITTRVFAAAVCILFGFGCKAGMFPVHVWLPKAHPVAPSPASALLSGVLTKVGIYGILMTTLNVMISDAGFGLLVLCLGVVTMALGAVLALCSINLKRTLACSSMSQIGFILTGIGMIVLNTAGGNEEGAAMAFSGTVLHMVNHSLIKLTLFMAAGVVVMNLGVLTLDDIRGWGKDKPFLKIAFALGALGISGVPLFNGYTSKTLLHEGIVEGVHHLAGMGAFLKAVEWIFLISGGITFGYMLKLFICIFIEEPAKGSAAMACSPEEASSLETGRGREAEENEKAAGKPCMNAVSTFAVFGSSLLMPVLGQPAVMKRLAAFMTGSEAVMEVRFFSFANLKGGLTSLIIGACVYYFIVRRRLIKGDSYVDVWPAGLDLEDLIYRPLLTRLLPDFFGRIAAFFAQNKVLGPLCRHALEILGKLAAFFSGNRLLIPAGKAVFFVLEVIGRALVTSMDALLVLLRRTIVREIPVESAEKIQENSWMTFREGVKDAAEPIFRNFSFALMMTCIGILLILGVLIYYIV